MAIGPVTYRYDFNAIDKNTVDTINTLEIVGVTVDCKLNFAINVNEQVRNACAKVPR